MLRARLSSFARSLNTSCTSSRVMFVPAGRDSTTIVRPLNGLVWMPIVAELIPDFLVDHELLGRQFERHREEQPLGRRRLVARRAVRGLHRILEQDSLVRRVLVNDRVPGLHLGEDERVVQLPERLNLRPGQERTLEDEVAAPVSPHSSRCPASCAPLR